MTTVQLSSQARGFCKKTDRLWGRPKQKLPIGGDNKQSTKIIMSRRVLALPTRFDTEPKKMRALMQSFTNAYG